nr:gag protein [Colletotrichum truncatum]KAF6781158.1 gag protein [Colletotrichum truncatum]
MSSRASAKSPTPGSLSSSRNQPQSLAQEPANTEDFDMPDLKIRGRAQTKSAKDYSANFRQLSVQLDLTEETKIFMFYQGLKDEVKDEIIKIDRPDDFL